MWLKTWGMVLADGRDGKCCKISRRADRVETIEEEEGVSKKVYAYGDLESPT